jgi:hypothetical protein
MLGFKPKVDEQIKKDLENKRKELAISRVPRLGHLIKSQGWVDYLALVDEYIEACKKRKAITAIDRADDKTIQELRLLDHEIFILSWMKEIPGQFINKTNEMVRKDNAEE